ncbi:hypothetical protein R3P38DRAFT_3195062 [Favolaschia claudopus]|uniref:Uncharacterized protein n=1 Tax=Favolaschia claudopus TaxID=2862362 RepID=A0AAW0BA17_9AGAR
MTLPVTIAVESTTYLRDVLLIVDKDGRYIPSPDLRKFLATYIREAKELRRNVNVIYDARQRGPSNRDILTEACVSRKAAYELLDVVRTSSQQAKKETPNLAVEAQIELKLRSTSRGLANRTIHPIVDQWSVKRLRKAQDKLAKEADFVIPGLCRMGGFSYAELLREAEQIQPILADANAKHDLNEVQDSETIQSIPLENESTLSATILAVEDTHATMTTVQLDADQMSDAIDSSDSTSASVLVEERLADVITRMLTELRLRETETNTFTQGNPNQGAGSPSAVELSPVASDEARNTQGGSRGVSSRMNIGSIYGGFGGQGGANSEGGNGGAGGTGMGPHAHITSSFKLAPSPILTQTLVSGMRSVGRSQRVDALSIIPFNAFLVHVPHALPRVHPFYIRPPFFSSAPLYRHARPLHAEYAGERWYDTLPFVASWSPGPSLAASKSDHLSTTGASTSSFSTTTRLPTNLLTSHCCSAVNSDVGPLASSMPARRREKLELTMERDA